MRGKTIGVTPLVVVGLILLAVVSPVRADESCTSAEVLLAVGSDPAVSEHASCTTGVGTCETDCVVDIDAVVTGVGLVGVTIHYDDNSTVTATESCGPTEPLTCMAHLTIPNTSRVFNVTCTGISLLAVQEVVTCRATASPV